MGNLEIVILTLLVLCFILLVLTNCYFKAVSDYFKVIQEENEIMKQMIENNDKICELLNDSYQRMYKLVTEEWGIDDEGNS